MAQRRRWTVALGIATAAFLTACSTAGNQPQASQQPSGTSSGSSEKVTITWATTNSGSTLPAEQKIADAFTAANPNITVKVDAINFSDYDTKLNTSLRSGQGPDVFRINHPNVQAWTNAGYLADLTQPIADNQIDTAKFVPGLLDIGKVNGKQYSLPIDTDARAFWYNPKLLEKAGLVDADGKAKPPSTWDELVDAVAKFKGSGTFGYVYRTDSDYAMAYEAVGSYIKTAGGQILSTDAQPQAVASTDENTIAAVTLLQKIAATGAVPPGESNMSEQTSNTLFANGKVAMMTGGPWVRDAILKAKPKLQYGTDYALAPIPTPEAGGTSASASGGWQIGVNAKSKNAAAAAKFLAFFEQPDNLISLASSNSFPPVLDGMNGEPFASDPFYDAFKQLLPNSGLPITPVPQMAQVSAAFESAARAAVNEGKDVRAQLAAFDKKVNEQVLQ
jgi:ABC-type glycerol-3-phosphate transport system substrate-binding protein